MWIPIPMTRAKGETAVTIFRAPSGSPKKYLIFFLPQNPWYQTFFVLAWLNHCVPLFLTSLVCSQISPKYRHQDKKKSHAWLR